MLNRRIFANLHDSNVATSQLEPQACSFHCCVCTPCGSTHKPTSPQGAFKHCTCTRRNSVTQGRKTVAVPSVAQGREAVVGNCAMHVQPHAACPSSELGSSSCASRRRFACMRAPEQGNVAGHLAARKAQPIRKHKNADSRHRTGPTSHKVQTSCCRPPPQLPCPLLGASAKRGRQQACCSEEPKFRLLRDAKTPRLPGDHHVPARTHSATTADPRPARGANTYQPVQE